MIGKTIYSTRYPTGEGSVVKYLRKMDQEINSVEPFIFQSVDKIIEPII